MKNCLYEKFKSIHIKSYIKGFCMDKTEQAIFDEELREREIKRLTSPLTYKKGRFSTKAYDIEGNEVQRNVHQNSEFIMEPKPGILTDDEILKYAYKSKVAVHVRLKKGIGTIEDKKILYGKDIFDYWSLSLIFGGMFIAFLGMFVHHLFFLLFPVMIIGLAYYTVYVLYLKDYTSIEYKNKTQVSQEENKQKRIEKEEEIELTPITNSQTLKRYESQVNDLKQLYEVKEKVAIDMIEKRFSPTEMTYEKFMSTLRSCSNLFYEQVESTLNIINFSSDNSPKVEYEIKNRIDVLKLIIEKVDELTNELVLNMSSLDSDSDEIRYLVEDMEKLIKSVKDYK